MIAIANVDFDWFNILSEDTPQEVNFWTPTPWNIKSLNKGDIFYFFLKMPYRKIGGYGYFSHYENLSTKEAWNIFGRRNGVNNLEELISRRDKYASTYSKYFVPSDNPTIGCIILINPSFFDEENYFDPKHHGITYPLSVGKLKYYPLEHISEKELIKHNSPKQFFSIIENENKSYSFSRHNKRKGQHQFRKMVLEAYRYKCAITSEDCLEVLETAHIQPYINENSNHIQNGIALRTDIHKLFDTGLLTIDTSYNVIISPFLSSTQYNIYNKMQINFPSEKHLRPSKSSLEYHNKVVFRG